MRLRIRFCRSWKTCSYHQPTAAWSICQTRFCIKIRFVFPCLRAQPMHNNRIRRSNIMNLRPYHFNHRFHAKRFFGKRLKIRQKNEREITFYLTATNGDIIIAGASLVEGAPLNPQALELAALIDLEEQCDAAKRQYGIL